MEWEILGDLGLRLHHKEEAKEAYQRCIETSRYSQKPWAKLLDMYADEGDINRTIQAAIRVATYQHADFTEITVSYFRVIIWSAHSMLCSIRHLLHGVSLNWVKSTAMPKYPLRY